MLKSRIAKTNDDGTAVDDAKIVAVWIGPSQARMHVQDRVCSCVRVCVHLDG